MESHIGCSKKNTHTQICEKKTLLKQKLLV